MRTNYLKSYGMSPLFWRENGRANSLFWKILHVTPYASRFCVDSGHIKTDKFNGIKILARPI